MNGSWYYCGTEFDWCAGAFNTLDLGEISALYLGGQSQAADNGNDWQGGQVQMFYKIDNLDIQTIFLDYESYGHGEYNNNMRFQSGGKNFVDTPVDISGFEAGSTHTIAVWFFCDVYDNNFNQQTQQGDNYVATFTKKAPTPIASSSDIKVSEDPVDVQINGLTLYKDTYWNTLCLPFSLSTVEIETSPLAGAEIRELRSSTLEGTTLTLNFGEVKAITAGTPYIIKWTSEEDAVVNPIFTGVTLSTSKAGFVEGDFMFVGNFDPETSIDGQDFLYLGAENTLYYPEEPVSIGAFRAYFTNRNSAGQAKAFVLNFDDDNETTSIKQINNAASATNSYFTIDGRRINDMPATAGLYIHNGKKVVIK